MVVEMFRSRVEVVGLLGCQQIAFGDKRPNIALRDEGGLD